MKEKHRLVRFFVKMISEKLRRIFCGNYNGGENMYRIYSTLIEMVAVNSS